METIVRNIRDLDVSDRAALERVVGHELSETQRVIVNVVNAELPEENPPDTARRVNPNVPDWWRIYDGLSAEEVDRLDAAVRQRANLTRVFE
jgi:hypothetical protein